MPFQCPVCNGLEPLRFPCPRCGTITRDMGRISDYYAPYSPYREIDDLKRTNGAPDLRLHQCIHAACCPECDDWYRVPLGEKKV